MEKTKTLISALELKRLLVEIAEKRPQVCLRYRLIGEMWQPNFMRVKDVTDKGVFLKDELQNKTVLIPDLKWIVQFELDGPIHSFAPNFHYQVLPDSIT